MAQVRITDLPIGTALTGTEQLPAVQAGVTVSSTPVDFRNFVIPAQSGNAGRMLTTDGANLSWTVPPAATPPQIGNAGKVLSTDGTNTTWILQYPAQTGNAGMVLGTNGTSVAWVAQNPVGVSSVAMTATSPLQITGSPITSTGTLALSWVGGQPANQFFATPAASAGAPSLRAITNADLPLISLATGVTGNLPVGNLAGGGGATSSTFWRGDGTWAAAGTTGNIISSTATSLAGMPIGQKAIILKTTPTSRSNTAVAAVDPDLQFTNAPAGSYLVEVFLTFYANNSTNGGIRSGVYCTGGGNGGFYSSAYLGSAYPIVPLWSIASGPTSYAVGNLVGLSIEDWAWYSGAIASSGGGTIAVSWAQNTANAATTGVEAGSYITVTRVA